jgi:hypothetical protein
VVGVVGLSVLVVLAPSAAARSTAHSRPSIVCPLVGTPPDCCGPIPGGPVAGVRTDQTCCTGTVTTGCCDDVPGSTCCATSTCPSAVSLAVSPSPAKEGSQAKISGTLSGGTSDSAQTVALWEKPAGQAAFSDVASTQTSASGAFSFLRKVTTNAQWYVKTGTAQSATVAQSVLAAIGLRPSSARPAPGAKFKLSGTIAPSQAGERVALQQLRSGRWVTVARPKLSARSRFTVTLTKRGRSVERFRIVLGADARNAKSTSSVIAVSGA